MAEQKETIILDFQVEQGDAIAELEKTKKSIIGLKEEQSALNKAYKEGSITVDEYASESVRVEQVLKKETATYGTLTKAVNTTSNSLNAQRLQLAELTKQRNALDRSTVEGVAKFNELNNSIKELNDTIKQAEQAGGDFRRNVGNYPDVLDKSGAAFADFSDKVNIGGTSLGDITGKLASFVNPATAAAAAVSGLAALYLSSAAGARDLESAQDQLSQSFTTVSNGIAELAGADGKGGGLLSKLAFEFNKAVFGLKNAVLGELAASAKQALKELEIAEIDAKAVAKRALDDSEKLRQIRDNDTKAFSERKKAAQDVLGFIEVRELVLVNVQQERINKLKGLLALDKDNLNLQKEVKLAELELADIREDSQGKRTEALNGIKTLESDLKAQRDALLESEIAFNAQQTENFNKILDTGIPAIQALIDKTKEYNNEINLSGALAEQEKLDKEEQSQANAQVAASLKKEADANKLATAQQIEANKVATQSANLFKQNSAAYKAISASQATVNTFLGATEALQQKSTLPSPFDVIAKIANVATIIATGLSAVSSITKAAGGGTFMTKGPQLLMVGDNPGGRERVTVEPISGRGKTVVGKNMIKLAGGGVVETQSATGPINQSFAFRSAMMNQPTIVASWKEATDLNTRVQFKESLVTL